MDVEEVEPFPDGGVMHGGGEREAVGRVVEEGVGRDLDLVVVDPLDEVGEPERLGVGDEMDLVPAPGEREPELGGDDAGAPVDGVAGDADPQGSFRARHSWAIRSASSGSGRSASIHRAPGGSWCRNQVSWRRA